MQLDCNKDVKATEIHNPKVKINEKKLFDQCSSPLYR